MTEITSIFEGIDELQGELRGVAVHPSAIVGAGAELDEGVQVGPHAIIGARVKLGTGVRVGAGAIVEGITSVGAHTTIFPHATVGSTPQDLKFNNEDAELVIGERNRIREYVNISIGTEGGGGKTVIGDNNLIMVYTHVGHDCIIGDDNIFANCVQLAGHVVIGNSVVFGGLAGAHQFSRYGDLAMIAGGAMCSQDVPPFCMVHGDRAKMNGLNVVGLRRSPLKNLSDIKHMYRCVYAEGLTVEAAIEKISAEVQDSPAKQIFLKFLKQSERGIVR